MMRVRFVPQGTIADATGNAGTLYLDVGNALRPGVIDHHQLGSALAAMGEASRATSRLVATYPHLVPEAVETLVLHRNSDFDCWLSVWLARRRLSGRAFPFGTTLLTDFAALNDQGLADFRTANALAPIACLLSETVGRPMGAWTDGRTMEQLAAPVLAFEADPPPTSDPFSAPSPLRFDAGNTADAALLQRGLAFVTWLFEQIARLRDRLGGMLPESALSLDMPDLFDFSGDWPEEAALADQDLALYRSERDDPSCCDIARIPLTERNGGPKAMVDALLWHRVPACRLHKFWARADRERVADGFTLTAIPIFEREQEGVPLSRVVVSVDPAKPYDLRHLGAVLERAECDREAERCNPDNGKTAGRWRARESEMREKGLKPRFQEAWCVNHDPWYDGRAHGHTIVDAPGRGSLLTIREVLEIVKGHLRLDLAEARARIAHPFFWSLGHKRIGFSQVLRRLGREAGLTRFQLDTAFEGVRDAFLGPVFDLFAPDGRTLSFHAWHLDPSLWPDDGGQEDGWRTEQVDLVLLRNGCGFLITHGRCVGGEMDGTAATMTAYLAGQKRRCEDTGILEKRLAPWLGTVRASTGVLHAAVRVRSVQADGRDLEQLCYKVAHRLDYRRDTESLHPDEDARQLSRNGRLLRLIPVQRDVLFGFSQRGACLCLLDEGRSDAKLDFYENRFTTAHYALFLIGLLQRTTLLSLSDRLGDLLRHHTGERASLLIRGLHVECVTRVLYGQVATHALLGQAYMHQSDMFQIRGLAAEVDAQAGAYDAFLREERNRKIKLITALYLPMQILDWLVGLKLVGMPEQAALTLSTGSLLAGVALLFAVLYAYILREPRYR